MEFVCKKCGTTLGANPAKQASIHKRECPTCGELWLVPDSTLSKAAGALLAAIHQLRALEEESTFSLRLHVELDEAKQKEKK